MSVLLKKLLVMQGYHSEVGAAGEGGGSGGAGKPAAELTSTEDGAALGSEATTGGAGGEVGEPTTGSEVVVKPEDQVAKRYSDLTKQIREAQERETRSREQLDAALRAVEQLTGRTVKPADELKPTVEPELVSPVFEDPEQYQRDMAVYAQQLAARSAKQAIAAAEADRERTRIEAENAAVQKRHTETWNARRTAAMERYPDYIEVAENQQVPISAAAALTITSLEHGGDVAYYLGQHLEEAQRIFALPPVLQAVELGKLEVKVTTPKLPTVSKAAEPIKPLTGSGSPQTRTDDELSMDEYAAKRNRKS